MLCDRWEKNLEMRKSGALGDETSPQNTLAVLANARIRRIS